MRRWLPVAVLGLAVLAIALLGREAVLGLRLAFLLAGAVPIGAVLLLAIAGATGADWSPAVPFTLALPAAAVVGVVAFACTAVPLPHHLAIWSHPAAVTLRALLVLGALLWVATRLPTVSATLAGVTLAVYTALVTPIATDWLLGEVPGHSVSAAGMILAVQEIAAACAAILVLDAGEIRFRRDMSGLLVAAMLGLGYLVFVDYLIIWFGNLPDRVGFYAMRAALPTGLAPPVALLLGVGGTIAGAATGRGRVAGACALAGIAITDAWWIGAGPLAWLVAALAVGAVAFVGRSFGRPAHG